jgi:hypothetical protein
MTRYVDPFGDPNLSFRNRIANRVHTNLPSPDPSQAEWLDEIRHVVSFASDLRQYFGCLMAMAKSRSRTHLGCDDPAAEIEAVIIAEIVGRLQLAADASREEAIETDYRRKYAPATLEDA